MVQQETMENLAEGTAKPLKGDVKKWRSRNGGTLKLSNKQLQAAVNSSRLAIPKVEKS